MVKRCVRIYVEGGAQGKTADNDFRRGWRKFLNELHELARANGYHALEIVRGKGRANTFSLFINYKRKYPSDLCVLLVDAKRQFRMGPAFGILLRVEREITGSAPLGRRRGTYI